MVIRDILSHGPAALASSGYILVGGLWTNGDYLSCWTGVSRLCLAPPPMPAPPRFSLNYSSSASFVCLSGLQTKGNLVHFLEWNIEAGGSHFAFGGWTSILVRHHACLEVLTADHEQDLGHDPG